MRPHTLLTALLASALAASPAAAAPTLDSPEALSRAVLEANPELEAVEAQLQALGHAAGQAGLWSDPVASLEYGSMPLTAPYPGANAMSGIGLSLRQTLPAPGKNAARRALAESKVGVARQGLRERQNALTGLVQDLYWRLTLVRQLKGVTEEHRTLVAQLLEVVRARYESGKAAQHDLLQLQVVEQRLADDLDELERQDRELVAAIDAAVHVPPGTPVVTPESVEAPKPSASLESLLADAETSRPLLEQLAESAASESLGVARAEKEKRPDVTVSLGYRARTAVSGGAMGGDPGEDFVSAGVSIPLPWFWNDERWGELASQHRAMQRSFRAQRTAAVDELRGRLDAALVRWRRAYQKAERYQSELVPAQRRTLDSVLADYQVGRAEFASLYQAQLVLLDFQRAILLARSDAGRAAVETETLTGTRLTRLEEARR